jgi:integrase/recombinase XerC/integrase/recombinase XerD
MRYTPGGPAVLDPVRDALGDHPLAAPIAEFLTDLHNAGRSAQTLRAYRGDLIRLAAHHDGALAELGAAAARGQRSSSLKSSRSAPLIHRVAERSARRVVRQF